MEPRVEDLRDLRQTVLTEIDSKKNLYCPRDLERVRNDKWLRRFLIENEMDVEKSAKQVLKILKWRNDNEINGIDHTNVNLKILHLGGAFSCSRDLEGKRLFVIRPAVTVKGTFPQEELRRVCLYWLERLEREENYNGVTIVADLTDARYNNMDLDLMCFLNQVLIEYYPEFCSYFLILNSPRVFSAFWAVVKLLIPAKKSNRVQFVNQSSLVKFVSKEQQLIEWGGSYKFSFEFRP